VLPPNSSHESMDTFRSLRLGLHAVKIPAQDLKSVSFPPPEQRYWWTPTLDRVLQ